MSKNKLCDNYELISNNFENAKNKLKLYCKIHKEYFYISWNKLSQGEGCYNCAKDRNSGENNFNYNPNLTQEERELKRYIFGDDSYKDWRNSIFKRDNYTCQCCEKVKGYINAHHIDGYNWCKEGRVHINNGITLCRDCHKTFHILYGKGNNTYEQLEDFLYEYNIID